MQDPRDVLWVAFRWIDANRGAAALERLHLEVEKAPPALSESSRDLLLDLVQRVLSTPSASADAQTATDRGPSAPSVNTYVFSIFYSNFWLFFSKL